MAILNAQNCDKTLLGTGLPECVADLGYPKGFIYTKPTWAQTIEGTTFDKDWLIGEIQQGNFYPFIDSFSTEQNTPDATTEESANGELTVVRNGLPQFTFSFIKSWQFQKIAYGYNGFGRFGVIFVFDNDVLLLAKTSDGKVTGFKAGMTNTNTYMFNSGSEQGKTPMSFQLLDNKQFNSQGEILNPEFDVTNEITGVIDCILQNGAAVTDTDTIVSIDIVARANPLFKILGLGQNNFRIIVDGSTVPFTDVTYNTVTNLYDITLQNPLSGGESVVVELFDAPFDIARLGDQLYKGVSEAITAS